MSKRGFLLMLALALTFWSVQVAAIEIEYEEGQNFVTITDLTIPVAPGAGTAGEDKVSKQANFNQGAAVFGVSGNDGDTWRVQFQYHQTKNGMSYVMGTVNPGWADLKFFAADVLNANYIIGLSESFKSTDVEPPGLEGFAEGSTELTISGLPEGASILTSYMSPGRPASTTWIEDGSWGDWDETVNGIIVTPPPRWSGPPHVLGGEILSIGLEGDDSGGLWAFEATGLGARYTVPVASHVIGASGDPFISDLTIANAFGVTAEGWIRFVEDGTDWQQAPSIDFTVAPGESLSWVDVVQSAFDITRNTKGVIVVGGVPTWSLAVVSRNYVIDSEGNRFGINIPGVSSFKPHTARNIWILPGLQENAAFRSNLILAGALPQPSTVEIRMLANGEILADEFIRTVPAYGLLQINRIARAMGVNEIEDAYLEITVDGAVYAALSVVDNSADDAAYQLAVPVLEVD